MTVPVPNTYLSLFPLASLRPSLNAGDFVVPFLSRSDPSKARRRRLQPELQFNYLHKGGGSRIGRVRRHIYAAIDRSSRYLAGRWGILASISRAQASVIFFILEHATSRTLP